MSDSSFYPKIRSLKINPVRHRGQPCLLLTDPMQLADQQIVIANELAPLFVLCDGTRDLETISTALMLQFGEIASPSLLQEIMARLDEVYLLDNDRSREAQMAARQVFREQAIRPPMLAGVSYPDQPDALRDQLNSYHTKGNTPEVDEQVRGLVSPHIDYGRGGPVYAAVWGTAKKSIQEAELVIILGTDHYGSEQLFTLTTVDYSTPYGVLPTAGTIVERLADVLGEDEAFTGELRHRTEHSVELAAVWLHHTREGAPCSLLPILCGDLNRFFPAGLDPTKNDQIQKFSQILQSVLEHPRTVVVAAGDLSHVGPAFGGLPVDAIGSAELGQIDRMLIEGICMGDADGLFEMIRAQDDRNNICGLAPIYHTLRSLGSVHGNEHAYNQCAADQVDSSIVSITGITLH